MTTIALAGCRPEPIGSYLKALGVLRLVSEQADPRATGWWVGDTFRLDSELDEDGLIGFFTERYAPTPVLSPWNSDSGFKEAGSTATTRLLAIEASDNPRFAPYQETVAIVRALRVEPGWEARPKAEKMTILRNHLPDAAVRWIDASVVLRPEGPQYPALLGTGGNLGRLELSSMFMGALHLVFDPAPKAIARSTPWLTGSLFERGGPALRDDKVGQFAPGAAGGTRSDAVGEGKPLTNPWDLVLLIEGSLLWAGGVARRLGSATSMASIPFTVEPSAAGHGSLTSAEKAKAELWAPLWTTALTLPLLERLFSEGRISWSGRQARRGVDAARAVLALGVDTGVTSFVRHVVAERMGQTPLAVPVGRFNVHTRPGMDVLASVDPWINRFRRAATAKSAPTSVVRAANGIDRALLGAVSGHAEELQLLLVAIAHAEAMWGRSERARAENNVNPVSWLSAHDWLPALDDGSAELRLAASVALACDDTTTDAQPAGTVRSLVRPIELSRRGRDPFQHVAWTRHEAIVRGLGTRPITEILADVLIARSETSRDTNDAAEADERGVQPWFPIAVAAGAGDTEALAAGRVDGQRLAELVGALLLLQPTPRLEHKWREPVTTAVAAQPAWRILAPFYARHLVAEPNAAFTSTRLRPEASWARRLRFGDVHHVITAALLRWEMHGHRPVYARRSAPALSLGVDGPALAASLACCPSPRDVRRALHAVAIPDTDPSYQGDPS